MCVRARLRVQPPRGRIAVGRHSHTMETQNGRATVLSRLGTARDYRHTTHDRRTARLSEFLSEEPMEIK